MNRLRCFMMIIFLFTLALKLSNCSLANSSLPDDSLKEAIVVKNATRVFVRKVFERFSRNGSKTISVKDFYSLLKTLRIGQIYNILPLDRTNGAVKSPDVHEKAHVDGKESILAKYPMKSSVIKTYQQKTIYNNTHRQKYHKNCIEKERLLKLHQINKVKGIDINDFILLCPSLVYELQSGACLHIEPTEKHDVHETDTTLKVWLFGFGAITVISLSSLFAITIIPCLGKSIYNKVMSFLVALAVGTLAGDAFLHLIPHAFLKGVHHHEGEVKPVWKGVVIMAGIYGFLMVESLMKLRAANREHKHKHDHDRKHKHDIQEKHEEKDDMANEEFPSSEPCQILLNGDQSIVNHNHCVLSHCDGDSRDTGLDSNETDLSDLSHSDGLGYGNSQSKKWRTPLFPKDTPEQSERSYSDNEFSVIVDNQISLDCGDSHDVNQIYTGRQPSSNSDINSNPLDKNKSTDTHHNHHQHGNKEINTSTSIATVAWMVIAGDGFHNFSDGLAVGAAFSSSVTSGLTTSIAVLCHELPHELGDFAVLIKSGISFKQALVYNLASAVIAYAGLTVGLLLGNLDSSHVWVLAITSGLFIYISLVAMLPELTNYQAKENSWSVLLWQNAGVLTGVLIMLVIALLEEH